MFMMPGLKTAGGLIVAACLLYACQPYHSDQLVGTWRGALILEEGDTVLVDPAEISLQFRPDDRYLFKSTLNYKEAGTYYLDAQYLFTLDTLNKASTEKAVEIVSLTPDSLHLKMMDNGRERLLKLYKE